MNIGCNTIPLDEVVQSTPQYQQLDLFTDYKEQARLEAEEQARLERERRLQETVLVIKGKFGKNSIVKGMNLEEDATMIERNDQIGGHKA